MDTNVQKFERSMEALSNAAPRARFIASHISPVACLRKTRDGTEPTDGVVDGLDSSARAEYFPLQLISYCGK